MIYFSIHTIRNLTSWSESDIASFEAIAIPLVCTAAISLIASTAMVFMIYCTQKGLSTPYRRIIFGLCLSDIFQSFALVTAPFSVPKSFSGTWGAGNDATCSASGFLLTFGMSAVPMYTCFLCWYYICKLKHRMTNETFSYKYEWKLHIVIALFNFIAACVGLGLNLYHPSIRLAFCQTATLPVGCRMSPELVGECDPIMAARVEYFILFDQIMVNVLCLLGIIGMVITLLCHVISMSRISLTSSTSSRISIVASGQGTELATTAGNPLSPVIEGATALQLEGTAGGDDNASMHTNGQRSGRNSNDEQVVVDRTTSSIPEHGEDRQEEQFMEEQYLQALHARENAVRLSILYRKETFLQANCYVGAFCITYMPAFILWGNFLAGRTPSKAMQVFPFIFYPLGGFFNILVYTRPQAANLKRVCPELPWLRCLWLILKAGGEMPTTGRIQINDVGNDLSHRLYDVDEPPFSLPPDYESIVTPSFVVFSSFIHISSAEGGHVGAQRYYYKWSISSDESIESFWRRIGVGARSISNEHVSERSLSGSSFANHGNAVVSNNADSVLADCSSIRSSQVSPDCLSGFDDEELDATV